MLYVDHTFEILENGALILDEDVKQIPSAKDGDEYILKKSESGRWVFQRKAK